MKKTVFEDRKTLVFSIIAFCIIIISITFFAISIGIPDLGITLSKVGGEWKVQKVEANSLAIQAGIQEGDIPITINGQPVEIFFKKYESVGTVMERLIDELSVVDNSGLTKSVSRTTSISIGSMIEIAAWFIACLASWICGLYIYFKKSKEVVSLLFCLCGLAFGLALSGNFAAVRGIPTAGYFEIIGTTMGPWLLMHFFLVLPQERRKLRNNPIIYTLYILPIITIILFPIIGYADGQPLPGFRTFRIIEIGLGIIGVICIAIFNYLNIKSVITRQQLRIILIGCLVPLIPFIVLSIIPAILVGVQVFKFSILLFAFIPLSMWYAIITKHIFDIDAIIRRSIIYGLISLIIGIILSIPIFYLLHHQRLLTIPQKIIIALALGVIAALLFGPVRKSVELLVDKLFYKDRYDYRQIIQSLNISLNTANDLTSVSRLVVGTAVNTLNLAGGCLYIKTQSSHFQVSASQGLLTKIGEQSELLTLISQHDPTIEFPNKASTAYLDLAYLIPLTAAEKEIGFLCLTEKASRQNFSSDDVFLIQEIASLASIKLHSVMLTQDVSIRDTFISVASHELRVPLTSIVGYTELLLKRDPPDDKTKRWIKTILDNGQRISAMVDDLLNVSRIQSGNFNITLEKVRLKKVLEEALLMAKEHSEIHEFNVNIEPDLPMVLIDREKLSHVIWNLLDNAIKYSPNGGRITLSAHNEAKENRLVISVADDGIGIAPTDKKSLFTTFHRIQRPETQGIRGSGLGLYIAKVWTEAMGGNIWVESELNKGSTFFISFPTTSRVKSSDKNQVELIKSKRGNL